MVSDGYMGPGSLLPRPHWGLSKENRPLTPRSRFTPPSSSYWMMPYADLQKDNISTTGGEDYIYGGDPDAWIMAAYSLKARAANRLSKIDATGSAADALAAAARGFASMDDDFTFDNWSDDLGHENTWYQEENERAHHSVSMTFYDILDGLNDPTNSAFHHPGKRRVCARSERNLRGRPGRNHLFKDI